MSSPKPAAPAPSEEWDSCIATIKALAEGPDAVDAERRTAALKLLWSASIHLRDRVNLPELEDLPLETRQLLHQTDNEQLLGHIAVAATKAVVALGKRIKQAASTAAETSSNAAEQQDAATPASLRVTKAAVLPAVQLLTTYAAVQRAWLNHPKYLREMFGQMTLQVMINAQLRETGLVRVLTAACPELAAAIKQHQQQQQSADAADDAAKESLLCTRLMAAAALQVLRRCILADRPAQIFWDETFAPMLLPTIKLAAVCLQAYTGTLWPPPAAAAGDSSAGVIAGSDAAAAAAAAAAAFDDWMELWAEDSVVGLEPICIADHISYAITQGYAWKPEEWPNSPPLVALMAAPELHLLLMLHAAAGTHHVINLKAAAAAAKADATADAEDTQDTASEGELNIKKQKKQPKSSSSSSMNNVPRWHEKVYVACGLPADVDLTKVFVLWGEDHPSIASVQVLGLALQMIGGGFWHPRFQQMSTSVGLLRVKEAAQKRQQQQGQQQQQPRRRPSPFGAIGDLPDAAFVADAKLRSALVLLLIQQMLVSPHIKRAVINLKLISQLASKGYCLDPDALLSAAAAAMRAATDPNCREARQATAAMDTGGPRSCATAALLEPVLLRLGPVLLNVLESFDPAQHPDVLPEDIDAATSCYTSTVAVAAFADNLSQSGHMAAALLQQQQQQVALRSLELAARASADAWGSMLTLDMPSYVLEPWCKLYDNPSPTAAKLLPNTYLPPPGLPTPAAAAAGAGDPSNLPPNPSSSSSSSSSSEAARPDSLPLFSLLLSGLKFQTGVVAKAQNQQQQQQQQPAGPIELLMFCADGLALLLKMSDLNEGPGGATSVRLRWLVLAGRLLISNAQAIKDLHKKARSISSSVGPVPIDPAFITHWLQSTTNAISWLGACLAKLRPPTIADPEAQAQLLALQQNLHMLLLREVIPNLRPIPPGATQNTAGFLQEFQQLAPASICEQLQKLGEGVVGLLPLPFCCNNASCVSCIGWGEEVSVKAGRCSSCKAAHYCCAACQKQHWSAQHKGICKKLKAQPESVAACLEAA